MVEQNPFPSSPFLYLRPERIYRSVSGNSIPGGVLEVALMLTCVKHTARHADNDGGESQQEMTQ